MSNNQIEDYMARHSIADKDAGRLWAYFQAVISGVQQTIIRYRKEMKGVDWGSVWNRVKEE